jgi:hypothetical protein
LDESVETAFCLISGIALVGFGFGLSRLRPPNWSADVPSSPQGHASIARWASFQRFVRAFNNILIVSIGAGIGTAGVLPHNRIWFLLWFTILVALLFCILLAFLDALSSMAGYRQAMPEAVRRSFQNSQS